MPFATPAILYAQFPCSGPLVSSLTDELRLLDGLDSSTYRYGSGSSYLRLNR
ncbi:hypothetical protein CLIM01_01895 [Colletotrichum limetticola]|uniref:Uncharacterized protein n=1 Tax=Colletotrichum limetticola TaxID=1209924 RepID=A0ABQ9QAC4_9PEZI|nr:hypothetical protein CLIM01_01895 [Colletotrichum limetticola]